MARVLTGLGYATLTVDSFGPRGIKRCPTPIIRGRRELSCDPDLTLHDAIANDLFAVGTFRLEEEPS